MDTFFAVPETLDAEAIVRLVSHRLELLFDADVGLLTSIQPRFDTLSDETLHHLGNTKDERFKMVMVLTTQWLEAATSNLPSEAIRTMDEPEWSTVKTTIRGDVKRVTANWTIEIRTLVALTVFGCEETDQNPRVLTLVETIVAACKRSETFAHLSKTFEKMLCSLELIDEDACTATRDALMDGQTIVDDEAPSLRGVKMRDIRVGL
jgi:hypothetical protein